MKWREAADKPFAMGEAGVADDNRWGDDPLLNTITSPLAESGTLRELMERFDRRERELAATDYADDDAVDAHQAEIDRVADTLPPASTSAASTGGTGRRGS